MANPPITIGPFTNVPAPGSGIRSDWAQQLTQYVVNNAGIAVPAPVRTQFATTGFAVPIDPNTARTWHITWQWWSWANNANGTMVLKVRRQGGADIGIITVPFAASAPPVPTLSGAITYRFEQPRGAATASLEAVIEGGTGPDWKVDGYLNLVGYPHA